MTHSKIKVLSDTTINKIAAGEVIENPSSVVKELVENALDAGALHISIEIKQGGRELIRISDDGEGMSYDDALLCLERHATSKIKHVEDIEAIATMGFRGEAIPSIASISKFSILTAQKGVMENDSTGAFVLVEGGKIITHTKAKRSFGTTIEVKTLFFNVPVRRKFQKSPSYDESEILKMLNILALARPEIQLELISDEKTLLKTSFSEQASFAENLKGRIEAILGKPFFKELLAIEESNPLVTVKGYIGSSLLHRPNKAAQFLFVNQRPIASSLIASFIKEGYGTMLPAQRYPVFILHLTLPGHLFDVNVHPQKKEIRLRQETAIKETLLKAMQNALKKNLNTPFSFVSQEEVIPAAWGAPFAKKGADPQASSLVPEETWHFSEQLSPLKETFIEKSSFIAPPCPSFKKETPPLPALPLPQTSLPQVISTLVGYIVLSPFHLKEKLIASSINKSDGGLLLVDQRRAFARITYEKLSRSGHCSDVQPLLIPLSLSLSKLEFEAVQYFETELKRVGFEVRPFGESTVIVDAIPASLKTEKVETLFGELLSDLIEWKSSKRMDIERDKKLTQIASRATFPKNKKLTHAEAQVLIDELLRCDVASICPQGKPIALYYTPEDIERWFDK